MWTRLLVFLFMYHSISLVTCGYPPMGDEVQPGSVLLPASRRGRYLANIVRRQAVDGTGIKFNKDADRMNAEAKKKVDVLSEELLPYIIAEQERRTTLYKRVMTAIQNGEKGVTIAEIRNKPPAIIRKGLMYRCPTNRAPREPDGSGVIMCEDALDPTPIMFESCLSAEDKELYVADNRYFFCNRHKIEGPDLPRNGTSVIGCAPCERTSLNYTSQKCALEDTDDVVVHYRYYPDRTYKFVSELDPDREVCEHWNPCQVGYIFSLPGPDQATPASELWHDYTGDTDEEISREEIVPPVPEDDKNETVFPADSYTTSPRKVRVPDGYYFHGVGKYMPNGLRSRVSTGDVVVAEADNMHVSVESVGNYVKITLTFRPLRESDATTYYARFEDRKPAARTGPNFVHIPLLTLTMGQTRLTPVVLEVLPAQRLNASHVFFTCARCVLHGILLRGADGSVRNVDVDRYRLRKFTDEKGVEQSDIEIDFEMITPRDFGDYFLMIQNEDGSEERMKAVSVKAPVSDRLNTIFYDRLHLKLSTGDHVDQGVKYTCDDCELTDVQCNGESVLPEGRFNIISAAKSVNINFASFEDKNACVYMGVFKVGDSTVRKIVAIIENNSPAVAVEVQRVDPPAEGEFFMHTISYNCTSDCTIQKMSVNGIPLETTSSRRSDTGSVAFYVPQSNNEVKIGITEYSDVYEGIFQAMFLLEAENVTKNLLEIGLEVKESPGGGEQGGQNTTDEVKVDPEGESEGETPPKDPDASPEEPKGEDAEKKEENKPEGEGEAKKDGGDKPEGEAEGETEAKPEGEGEGEAEGGAEAEPDAEAEAERRQRKKPRPGSRRNVAKTEKPDKLDACTVQIVRASVPSGPAYNAAVQPACPGGQLVAVSCRGHNVSKGLSIADHNAVNIDFAHFEDANACVYVGVFKIGNTEHKKTLAVLENNSPQVNVTLGAVVPAPGAGPLKHTVVYTCSLTKCDPEKIYINDKILKSDDKNPAFSYKSQPVNEKDQNMTSVTLEFAIAPFSKEFEGVYQLELSNGTHTVTKNVMEVGYNFSSMENKCNRAYPHCT